MRIFAVLIVLFTAAGGVGCAQEPVKKDEPAEVVGTPPNEEEYVERRGRLLTQSKEIESPTAECDAMWADDPVGAAKCAAALLSKLVAAQDQRSLAIIWPKAEFHIQGTGDDGKTDTFTADGKQIREELSIAMRDATSAFNASTIWDMERRGYEFDRAGDGSVRASLSGGKTKLQMWFGPIEGEMRIVRFNIVTYRGMISNVFDVDIE